MRKCTRRDFFFFYGKMKIIEIYNSAHDRNVWWVWNVARSNFRRSWHNTRRARWARAKDLVWGRAVNKWMALKCQTLGAVIVLVCWLEWIIVSRLSHACHAHSVLFLPMQSSLTNFWRSFTGLVQLTFIAFLISHYLVLLLSYVS